MGMPALTLTPLIDTFQKTSRPLSNVPYARKLLKDYCEEHECLPSSIHLTLTCSAIGTPLKVAESVRSDLKIYLGIVVDLCPKESKQLYADITELKHDQASQLGILPTGQVYVAQQ